MKTIGEITLNELDEYCRAMYDSDIGGLGECPDHECPISNIICMGNLTNDKMDQPADTLLKN